MCIIYQSNDKFQVHKGYTYIGTETTLKVFTSAWSYRKGVLYMQGSELRHIIIIIIIGVTGKKANACETLI